MPAGDLMFFDIDVGMLQLEHLIDKGEGSWEQKEVRNGCWDERSGKEDSFAIVTRDNAIICEE